MKICGEVRVRMNKMWIGANILRQRLRWTTKYCVADVIFELRKSLTRCSRKHCISSRSVSVGLWWRTCTCTWNCINIWAWVNRTWCPIHCNDGIVLKFLKPKMQKYLFNDLVQNWTGWKLKFFVLPTWYGFRLDGWKKFFRGDTLYSQSQRNRLPPLKIFPC